MSTRSRRRFDDDDIPESQKARHHDPIEPQSTDDPDDADELGEPAWSTYPDAGHGPEPVPPWVLTSPAAIDTDLGVLKSGKEADVALVRRTHDDRSTLLAAKRYRDAKHRLFHRDSGYLEGRRVRRSREMRAMETRTEFGRELIAGQWAAAEFHVLGRLWSAGASVPYPVQLLGTELLMEFIGTADGVAAPRLAQLRPGRSEADDLFTQMHRVLRELADAGYTHGDLSPYNVLVHDGHLMLIDLPQAVDLVGNPQGFGFLRRDCEHICDWFVSRGVRADARQLEADLLSSVPGR